MSVTPFIPSKERPVTGVLDRVHSDVMGPISPQSKGGARYIVTFIDEFSNHVSTHFAKQKSEVPKLFKNYATEVENKHGKKIKVLRTDNGKVYCNEELNEFLRQKGITRELTVPYSPQQNGKAERENRTLMDMVRCLLIHSGMPRTFWADAVQTAAYIRNRCPSQAIGGEIPEEKWTGNPVNLSNLRVFGCRAWIKIPKEKIKSKLQEKALPCVLLGYPPGVKGYKVWDPETDKVYISRDVVFHEEETPMLKNCGTNEIPQEWFGTATEDLSIPENVTTNGEGHQTTGRNDYPALFDDETDVFDIDRTSLPLPYIEDAVRRSDRIGNMRQHTIAYSAREYHSDPKSVREALNGENSEKWHTAMKEEMENHIINGTWKIVPRPIDQKVIKSKWVFKTKHDDLEVREKFKARLVAVGCTQKYGIDYTETFSPVIRLRTVRLLIAVGIELGWLIEQEDVIAAYLNEILEEKIYMEQAEGCEVGNPQDKVYLLKRSIYGLKQSGRNWNECLNRFLLHIGLNRSKAEPCVYYNMALGLIVGDYVDDLIEVAKDRNTLQDFKTKMHAMFKMKDLGRLSNFLSIRVTWDEDNRITLDQSKYIEDILTMHQMQDSKSVGTPMEAGWKPTDPAPSEDEEINFPYRQAIGQLLFLSNGTRPDLAFVTSYLSQFCSKSTMHHWKAVKRVFRYLRGTSNMKLTLTANENLLKIYSNADWGSDCTDRKSYSGYVVIQAGAAIGWCARKQRAVALSSMEAEWMALCETTKEVLWIQSFLKEMGLTQFIQIPTRILADNQAVIANSGDFVTSERNKHISLKRFRD